MTEAEAKWLFDIQEACDALVEHITSTPTLPAYLASRTVRAAVERELIVIGEAVNRIRRGPTGIELTDAQRIVQFRNHIVHGYDSIQHASVWLVIQQHIPILRAEVTRLLNATDFG